MRVCKMASGSQIYGVGKVWAALIFLLNKVKQKAVHILVENYFTYCIPNYFLDTCTKRHQEHENNSDKIGNKTEQKMKSFTTF